MKELSSGSRSGVISRDNPLHVDHINRFWDRFSAAMKDKDLAIQAELSRQVFRVDVLWITQLNFIVMYPCPRSYCSLCHINLYVLQLQPNG